MTRIKTDFYQGFQKQKEIRLNPSDPRHPGGKALLHPLSICAKVSPLRRSSRVARDYN
jgi:hypothetical protein